MLDLIGDEHAVAVVVVLLLLLQSQWIHNDDNEKVVSCARARSIVKLKKKRERGKNDDFVELININRKVNNETERVYLLKQKQSNNAIVEW